MCRKTQSLQHTVSKLVPAIQFHGIPSHHSDRPDTLDMGMAAVNTLSGNHETVSYEQFQEITFCFDSKVCFSCLQREALTSSLAADERLFSCHLSRIFVFTASQLQNHQFQGHATPHLSLNLSYITTGINMEKCSSILLYCMKHNMTCHWNANFKKGASLIAMDVETD